MVLVDVELLRWMHCLGLCCRLCLAFWEMPLGGYHAEYSPVMFMMPLSVDLRRRQTDGWAQREADRRDMYLEGKVVFCED